LGLYGVCYRLQSGADNQPKETMIDDILFAAAIAIAPAQSPVYEDDPTWW
jgi:hypothetical protein